MYVDLWRVVCEIATGRPCVAEQDEFRAENESGAANRDIGFDDDAVAVVRRRRRRRRQLRHKKGKEKKKAKAKAAKADNQHSDRDIAAAIEHAMKSGDEAKVARLRAEQKVRTHTHTGTYVHTYIFIERTCDVVVFVACWWKCARVVVRMWRIELM